MKKSRRSADEAPKLQFAVLPWRRTDRLEIMLVSSRETVRWVLPKGWPMKGLKPHKTAAREALEEAGILGKVAKTSLGDYSYAKRLEDGSVQMCRVEVFALLAPMFAGLSELDSSLSDDERVVVERYLRGATAAMRALM